MAEYKQYKENENKIHEQLYDNLFLLSLFYPTSKDFKAVFKKDMFVKNNKAAFFHVVYYLLNTLNADLTSQKITTWPPYDIKRENKFRTEVFRYINELNMIYDNADIPHIMSSHLITPGGFKFAKFMFRLTQLVIYEHLKKTEEFDMLYYLKPSGNTSLTSANINNLKRKTATIENEIQESINNFQSYHFQLNEKAISIDNELITMNTKNREAKKKNAEVREEFDKKYPSYSLFSILEEKLKLLGHKWECLQDVQNLFLECEKLISYLNSNELVLEHCKEELKFPNEVLHVIQNRDQLDLSEFFHAVNVLLKQKALELPNPTNSFVNHNIKKIEDLIEQYTELDNTSSENLNKLQAMITNLQSELKELAHLEDEESEEPLGVPLADSEED